MNKKILYIDIQSTYGVLNVFLKELYREFEKLGYEVDEIKDLRELPKIPLRGGSMSLHSL